MNIKKSFKKINIRLLKKMKKKFFLKFLELEIKKILEKTCIIIKLLNYKIILIG